MFPALGTGLGRDGLSRSGTSDSEDEPLAPAQGGAEEGRRGAQSVAAQEVVNSSLGNLHS